VWSTCTFARAHDLSHIRICDEPSIFVNVDELGLRVPRSRFRDLVHLPKKLQRENHGDKRASPKTWARKLFPETWESTKKTERDMIRSSWKS